MEGKEKQVTAGAHLIHPKSLLKVLNLSLKDCWVKPTDHQQHKITLESRDSSINLLLTWMLNLEHGNTGLLFLWGTRSRRVSSHPLLDHMYLPLKGS